MPAPGTLGEIPAVGVVPVAFPVRVSAWPHAELISFRVSVSMLNASTKFNEQNAFTVCYDLVTVRDRHNRHGRIHHPFVKSSLKSDRSNRSTENCQSFCQFFRSFLLPSLVLFQFILQLVYACNRQRNNDFLPAHDTLTFVTAMDTEFSDLATRFTM